MNFAAKNQHNSCIVQLSKNTGIDVNTIHYFQDVGLIKKSMVENTMDISTTIRYLKFVKRALKLGFSESEIKNLLFYIK
jgi:DNA-binding transcriptional MerR regulator